jgi:bacteriocin-like protein
MRVLNEKELKNIQGGCDGEKNISYPKKKYYKNVLIMSKKKKRRAF